MTKIWHTANLVGFILNYQHFLASIQVATTLLRHKFKFIGSHHVTEIIRYFKSMVT